MPRMWFSAAKDLCTYSRTDWGHSRAGFWVFADSCGKEAIGRSSTGGVGRPRVRRTDTGVKAVAAGH